MYVYINRAGQFIPIIRLQLSLFYAIILKFVQLIFCCLSFQARVEDIVLKFYRSCREGDPVLLKPKHIQFLKKAVTHLNDTYEVSTTFNSKQCM